MYNPSLFFLVNNTNKSKHSGYNDDINIKFIIFIIIYILFVGLACGLFLYMKDNFKQQPIEFLIVGYNLEKNNSTSGDLLAESKYGEGHLYVNNVYNYQINKKYTFIQSYFDIEQIEHPTMSLLIFCFAVIILPLILLLFFISSYNFIKNIITNLGSKQE